MESQPGDTYSFRVLPVVTRSCPTAGSLISSLATLNEIPYGKRRELPLVGIRRYGDYCGERLGSIVSVSSFSSDALYLNQGRCQWEAINLELRWLNHQFYGVFYCSVLNLARYEEGYSASVSVLALRDANHPYARRKLRCD